MRQNIDDFGVLCLVGMVGTVVDVHIVDDGASKTVFGEHTFHNLDEEGVVAGLDVLVERLLHEHFGSGDALAAGIAGVAQIFAIGPLLAGETHLVGVDNDYIVATLYEG